jgi:hypothetical protein
MCELHVIRYKGCEHADHISGKLHEQPIYCAELEFIEKGVCGEYEVCLMCRAALVNDTQNKGKRKCEVETQCIGGKGTVVVQAKGQVG